MKKDIEFFKPQLYGRRFSDEVAPSSSSAIWMLSFTDIMALMLTFFVMTFAMSDSQDHKAREFMDSLRGQLGVSEGLLRNVGENDVIEIKKVSLRKGLDLEYVDALLKEQVKKTPSLARVQISPHTDGLMLSLPQDLLFAPGKNVMTKEGATAVKSLAYLLRGLRNRMSIVGHTDPRAFRVQKGSALQSNWGLSLARAQAVATGLQSAGYDRALTVRGQSSGRYDELPRTVAESERLKYARRVDIVILADDGKALKRLGQ